MLLAIVISTTPLRPLTGEAFLRPLTGTRTAPVAMRFDDWAKPGDWTCGDCGANVFARKQACFRCGAPRGDRPASAAPRGGFDSGGRPDAPYMRTSPNPNPDEPYMREPGDTDEEIDASLVDIMVSERAALRGKGDFGAADAVRDELMLMGVTVRHGPLSSKPHPKPKPTHPPTPTHHPPPTTHHSPPTAHHPHQRPRPRPN